MVFCFGDTPFQIPDLTGKVAMVTGANTGMGYVIAEQLALNGAKVWMGARSEGKAKEAIEKFHADHEKTTKKGDIIWLPLDLTSPTDVMDSVKSLLSQTDRLHILVNNAARLAAPYELTKDGLETSVAINHIGHFTLTTALLPLLRHTSQLPGSDIRVITVSSHLHNYMKTIKLSTKEDFNNTFSSNPASADSILAQAKRYNFTKLLNVLFAAELQRRADQDGIPLISISLHPGVVATGGALERFPAVVKPMLEVFGKTPLQGAEAALVAATSLEVRTNEEKYKGAYLAPGGKLARASEAGRDEKLAKQLWELSEKTVKDILEVKGSE
ncbi:NAD-P-binding protein [Cadophora sp. DSE1049]|nr:NAD-P-binding protein [Cadophora sp. DSE1049]